ncbi:MAG: peptidoglycan-associated lipoprotein Pal [Alphaproteobacteria bacterium]|nr:peptidoglycan-associated lipoprotein Pal [Alphaproteobacteria bacterium]
MHLKFLSVVAAAFLLAACQSDTTGATGKPTSGGESGSGVMVGGPSEPTQEWLVMNIGDRVFFDYDRYELKADARAVIEGWAGWLNQHPQLSLVVEGHADERGTREYNLALGNRRANVTMEYLTAMGVDSGRLAIVSFGKERPAVLGSSEAAYSQNRRGVLVLN